MSGHLFLHKPVLLAFSKTDVTPATLTRDKGSRVKVAGVTGRVTRCVMVRRSRATRFWNRVLLYDIRL